MVFVFPPLKKEKYTLRECNQAWSEFCSCCRELTGSLIWHFSVVCRRNYWSCECFSLDLSAQCSWYLITFVVQCTWHRLPAAISDFICVIIDTIKPSVSFWNTSLRGADKLSETKWYFCVAAMETASCIVHIWSQNPFGQTSDVKPSFDRGQ